MSRRRYFAPLGEHLITHNRRMSRAFQSPMMMSIFPGTFARAWVRFWYYRAQHELRLCRHYGWKPEPWATCSKWAGVL